MQKYLYEEQWQSFRVGGGFVIVETMNGSGRLLFFKARDIMDS